MWSVTGKHLVAGLAVAVLGLGAALGWALTRDGEGEQVRVAPGLQSEAPLRAGGAPARAQPSARLGAGMMGSGMMGYPTSEREQPVRTLAEAKHQAQRLADPLGLHVGEVIEFENNYYAELLGPSERRATEVLVDLGTGAVWLEYGPAMMWNTRYGMMGGPGGMMGSMMGGMMGGGYGPGPSGPSPGGSWPPAISGAQAEAIANRWLQATARGLRAGEAEAFPGYYTLDVLRTGRIAGMLSVNAFSGAVWYHWWHGRFVREQD